MTSVIGKGTTVRLCNFQTADGRRCKNWVADAPACAAGHPNQAAATQASLRGAQESAAAASDSEPLGSQTRTIHTLAQQHPPAMPSGMSPSSYLDYRNCPRKWAFRKVLGVTSPPNGAMVSGTAAHLTIERAMELPAGQRTGPEAQQKLDETLGQVRAHLESDVKSDGTDDPTVQIAADLERSGMPFDRFETIVRESFDGFLNTPGHDPDAVDLVDNEQQVDGTFDTDYGPVPVRGIIDRVERNTDGTLRVVDYKSGKVPTFRGDDSHDRQILFYAAMLRGQGHDVTSGALMYVRHAQVGEVDVSAENVNALKQDVGSVWKEANERFADLSYEPNSGSLCGWCDHVQACPEGEQAVRDQAEQGRLKDYAPAKRTFGL